MKLDMKKYEFDTLGFTTINNVLSADSIKDLREKLISETEAQNKRYTGDRYKSDQWMLHNLMFVDSSFLNLLNTPEFLNMLDYALGDTSIIYAYQSSSMPPQGTNYSHRVHVDCPRFIENYVSNVGIIFALDDFTAESGATYFLPGSHKSSQVPDEEYFFTKAQQVYCKAGDMIFFNARTFHSGGANRTNKVRAAITINCCRSYMRQRFNFPEMADQNFSSKLNENQKRLLGYNVRVPKSLEQFYLPESERLYKANQG